MNTPEPNERALTQQLAREYVEHLRQKIRDLEQRVAELKARQTGDEKCASTATSEQ